MCVNDFNMAPSEAWSIDIVEFSHLLDNSNNNKDDLSVMLNFERIRNGANKKWLYSKG